MNTQSPRSLPAPCLPHNDLGKNNRCYLTLGASKEDIDSSASQSPNAGSAMAWGMRNGHSFEARRAPNASVEPRVGHSVRRNRLFPRLDLGDQQKPHKTSNVPIQNLLRVWLRRRRLELLSKYV